MMNDVAIGQGARPRPSKYLEGCGQTYRKTRKGHGSSTSQM